jgi:tetratricopeptide (TPR) repeat protein
MLMSSEAKQVWDQALERIGQPPEDKQVWAKHDAPHALACVMIEFRKDERIRPVLWNMAHVYGGTEASLVVVHGTKNLEYIKETATAGWKNVKYVCLPFDNIDIEQYNQILTSPDFWGKFKSDHVLIFQTDSLIRKPVDPIFFDYAFVGAPWTWLPNGSSRFVGNGGFSLRCVQLCKQVCEKSRYDVSRDGAEDVFFAKFMPIDAVPPGHVAGRFSVETVYNPDPCGMHNAFTYLPADQIRELVKWLPGTPGPLEPKTVNIWDYVSLGEVVDRVSILEIKLEHCDDPVKRANLEKEYERWWSLIPEGVDAAPLKEINARLWDHEDRVRELIRADDFGPDFVEVAKAIPADNDERYARKRRINQEASCDIQEEKLYVEPEVDELDTIAELVRHCLLNPRNDSRSAEELMSCVNGLHLEEAVPLLVECIHKRPYEKEPYNIIVQLLGRNQDAILPVLEMGAARCQDSKGFREQLQKLRATMAEKPKATKATRKTTTKPIKIKPDVRALNMLVSTGRYRDILAMCEGAEAQGNTPKHSVACNSRNFVADESDDWVKLVYAEALWRTGDFQAANDRFTELIEKHPDLDQVSCKVTYAQGEMCTALRDFETAKELYECLLDNICLMDDKQDIENLPFSYGCLMLLMGNYREAYEYIAMYAKQNLGKSYNYPWWEGDLGVKTLAVIGHYGIGDQVMYARFLPEICKKAERVLFVMASFEELDWLFKEATLECPNLEVIRGSDLDKHSVDAMVSILALPKFAGVETVDDIPFLNYLSRGDPARTPSKRVLVNYGGQKNNPVLEYRRCVPCDAFVKLLDDVSRDVSGIQWVSVMRDLSDDDKEALTARGVDLRGDLIDAHTGVFQETYALLQDTDLVVTTDTGLAHLAGTMNVPVVLLLSAFPEARWGVEGDTTAWYPSFKVVRQSTMGEWDEAIAEAATFVKAFLGFSLNSA